jgi:hypothetical protein
MLLPDHLPASFEGKYGHIRYTVKGILLRPWKHNHEVMATFSVMPKLDLNLDPLNRVSLLRKYHGKTIYVILVICN